MLATLPDYAAEELRHIARTEKVGALDDLIQRRTLIALSGRDRPEVRAEIGALVAPVPQRVRA